MLHGLRQLTASAEALHESGSGGVVRSSVLVAPLPLYLTCPPGLVTVSQAKGHWELSAPDPAKKYSAAVEAANDIGLDPGYDYLIFYDNGSAGSMTGLGLAASKADDPVLYTNREWSGSELLPNWGPIRPLTLPESENATVDLITVS